MTATARLVPVVLTALAPLLLAACATRVTLPALPDCHPANPDAATAPLAAPSGVLEHAAPIPAAEPDLPEEQGEHDGHEHGEHGHEHEHEHGDQGGDDGSEAPP